MIHVLWSSHHVVIDSGALGAIRINVPNLDAELIDPGAARLLAIHCGDDETIVAGSINRSRTLELSHGSRDHKPLINYTRELEVGWSAGEVKCGWPTGNSRVELVPRVEAETRFTFRRRNCGVGASRRVDKT